MYFFLMEVMKQHPAWNQPTVYSGHIYAVGEEKHSCLYLETRPPHA